MATKLARAHFGNLDERFKQIRTQLLDENSDLSRELRFLYLLDNPEMAENLRARLQAKKPAQRVSVGGRFKDIPYDNPEKLQDEVKEYLSRNYQIARLALLEYLQKGSTEEVFWADISTYNLAHDRRYGRQRYNNGDHEVVYRINLYLKEIDSVVTLGIGGNKAWFDAAYTRPYFGDIEDTKKRQRFIANYYTRNEQFAWKLSDLMMGYEAEGVRPEGGKFLYFMGRLDGHFSNLSQEELMARNIKPEYRYLPTTKSEMAELPKLERPAPRVPDNIPQYLRRRQ